MNSSPVTSMLQLWNTTNKAPVCIINVFEPCATIPSKTNPCFVPGSLPHEFGQRPMDKTFFPRSSRRFPKPSDLHAESDISPWRPLRCDKLWVKSDLKSAGLRGLHTTALCVVQLTQQVRGERHWGMLKRQGVARLTQAQARGSERPTAKARHAWRAPHPQGIVARPMCRWPSGAGRWLVRGCHL